MLPTQPPFSCHLLLQTWTLAAKACGAGQFDEMLLSLTAPTHNPHLEKIKPNKNGYIRIRILVRL